MNISAQRTLPKANVSIDWTRRLCDARQCRRALSTTSIRQASKAPKKNPIATPKPKLQYKPSSRRPPPRMEPPPQDKTNPLKHRTIPIIFGSIAILAFSSYSTYLYVTLTRAPETPVPSLPSAQADVSERYNTIARNFDETVDFPETLLRINKLRKKLVSKARGDVLEVSVGTGRNLEYYPWNPARQNKFDKVEGGSVTSFTGLDISQEMIDVARDKFWKLFPQIIGERWIVADASKEVPAAPNTRQTRRGSARGKYDTIIQTMGLCSADDPVALLKNLGNYIVEEDGRILLLEHGRGNLHWLNRVLDNFAEAHAKEFGCWWNRDLEKIVRESGLDIVDMHSIWWHGGTTWWIELKKPIGALPEQEEPSPAKDEGKKNKWW